MGDSFNDGPQAVFAYFANLAGSAGIDEMDAKRLADNCWTRASTLARSQADEARKWARAALAGYEFLSKFGQPATARSAEENAAALRAWNLVRAQPLNSATAPA